MKKKVNTRDGQGGIILLQLLVKNGVMLRKDLIEQTLEKSGNKYILETVKHHRQHGRIVIGPDKESKKIKHAFITPEGIKWLEKRTEKKVKMNDKLKKDLTKYKQFVARMKKKEDEEPKKVATVVKRKPSKKTVTATTVKRGRPAGSKNKPKAKPVATVKRGRGRPKGSKNKTVNA